VWARLATADYREPSVAFADRLSGGHVEAGRCRGTSGSRGAGRRGDVAAAVELAASSGDGEADPAPRLRPVCARHIQLERRRLLLLLLLLLLPIALVSEQLLFPRALLRKHTPTSKQVAQLPQFSRVSDVADGPARRATVLHTITSV